MTSKAVADSSTEDRIGGDAASASNCRPRETGRRAAWALHLPDDGDRVALQTLEGLASVGRAFSHALNNILASSIGNLLLLRSCDSDDLAERTDLMNEIHLALRNAQALARNLAARSHWKPYSDARVDLNAFMTDHQHVLCGLIPDHHVLQVDLPEGACMVRTDPAYLELALNALVLHACDDLMPGDPLRLSCRQMSSSRLPALGPSAGLVASRWTVLGVEMTGQRIPASQSIAGLALGGAHAKAGGDILGLWLLRQYMRVSRGRLLVLPHRRHKGYRINLCFPAARAARAERRTP